MKRKIHQFENGVRVFDDHLLAVQRDRYLRRNVHEIEEEDVFVQVVKSIPPNGCFVNIGSAIGYYPLLAKTFSPSLCIHAVEPLQEHRNSFVENIELNGHSLQDFNLHNFGISEKAGEIELINMGYGSRLRRGASLFDFLKISLLRFATISSSLFPKKGQRGTSKRLIRITTISLDDLMDHVGRPADLLQMDVQGSENDILRGGKRSLMKGLIGTILIGTHGRKRH